MDNKEIESLTDAENSDEQRTRGRRPNGLDMVTRNVNLEREMVEWAQNQPGGLSPTLRLLMRQAFEAGPSGPKDEVSSRVYEEFQKQQTLSQDLTKQQTSSQELTRTEMFFLESLRALPPEAIKPLIQVMGNYAEQSREARRWQREYMETLQVPGVIDALTQQYEKKDG